MSVLVRSCEVEGKVYREFEEFDIGVDGCVKCICAESKAKCDNTKCHGILVNNAKPHPIEANQRADEFEDFSNIKNQIAKQYFSNYDPAKLKIITDALGCKSTDCPPLLSASNIEYNVLDVHEQRFVGKGERINKVVIQSADTEVVNSSPAPQITSTVAYFLKCIQYYEMVITKTKKIRTEKKINLVFYRKRKVVEITETEVSKYSETNETTIGFPSQNITTDPFTRMNVTFNFFQFDDVINYSLDLEIALNSTISHPEVDANSNVVFVKKELGDFLQKHVDFLPTLKYPNDTVIQIVEKEDNGQKFILKNFPSSEKITGYGVDVTFGRAAKA